MHSAYRISGLVENEYVFGYFLICHFVSTQTWHTGLLTDWPHTDSFLFSFPPLSLSLHLLFLWFREKLAVARLQREVARSKSEGTMVKYSGSARPYHLHEARKATVCSLHVHTHTETVRLCQNCCVG